MFIENRPSPIRDSLFWRAWWLVPLLVGLTSRIWVMAWLLFGHTQSHHLDQSPWTIWDGAIYVSIAKNGYHAAPLSPTPFGAGFFDFSFFPGWPVLVRVVSLNGLLPIETVSPVLGNLLFLVVCLLLFRFFSARFERRIALAGLALFAFAPSSFVYSLGYSESLFLVLTVSFFLGEARGRARPVLTALAQSVRLTGLALSVGSLSGLWRSRGRDVRLWLTVLAAPLVFLAWWGYIALLTGDPIGYMLGTPSALTNWGAPAGIASLLSLLDPPNVQMVMLAPVLLSLGIAVYGIWYFARRHDLELALFILALVTPGLLLSDWRSMPRYFVVAFPAFGALAGRLGPRMFWVIFICCALLDAFVAMLVGAWVTNP